MSIFNSAVKYRHQKVSLLVYQLFHCSEKINSPWKRGNARFLSKRCPSRACPGRKKGLYFLKVSCFWRKSFLKGKFLSKMCPWKFWPGHVLDNNKKTSTQHYQEFLPFAFWFLFCFDWNFNFKIQSQINSLINRVL